MKHYSRTLGLGLAITSLSWAGSAVVSNSRNNTYNSFAVLVLAGFGFVPLLASLKSGRKSAAFRKTSSRLGLILTAANCTTAAFTFRAAAGDRPDQFMSDPQWMR
jgi:hypothetical protein